MVSIKNGISFFVIAFTLMACGNSAAISGKITDANKAGAIVYLIKPESLRSVGAAYFGEVIDSAEVKADGRFEFLRLPPSEQPVLFELAMQTNGKAANYLQTDFPSESNYMPVVWQNGESIEISATQEAFQKSFAFTHPSPANLAMMELKQIHQQAFSTYLEGKTWDMEDADQLMGKAHAIAQYREKLIEFATNTSHLLPALVAIRWVSPENDFERVPEFLVNQCHKWQETQPNHPWVTELCNQSEPTHLPVLVGSVFPNLTFPMLTDDTIALNTQLGEKLTIIDLWASWCAPCRKENRQILLPLWEAYHTQGFQIVGYALEGNEVSWRAAAQQDGVDRWPQASDLQGDEAAFLKIIRIRTIPANFILDKNGVVLAKNIHGKALSEWVKKYMEGE
tara:strand:+ start:4884 stop:6068 length:1185 start_codon:yes stop_codon:yes gene_type:complete